ncbi:serine/threonine-protein kinase Pink1, mitochondrial-like [Asterias amurensis]|uniref:serine/threonine-protein kinase Pink1, mitochondrial-like n=1 Tax=Asterias amurensis TaxID=7602 RepID=UPI003AB17170
MSLIRLALAEVVRLARRRVLLGTYKNNRYPAVKPQNQAVSARLSLQKTPITGQRGRVQSFAAQLRRNAALRFIETRNAAYGRRAARWGGLFPGFAFVGLTLAAGESDRLLGNGNETVRKLPLDTCCDIVRDIFGREDKHLDPHLEEKDFPSDITSYDISKTLLGKGTSASIYAARLLTLSEERELEDEDSLDEEVDDENEDDWEMVSDDGGLRSGNLQDAESETVEGFTLLGRLEEVSDADEDVLDEASEKCSQELPSEADTCESYDLAVKMMFNYDIDSNFLAISHAFQREYLPLWPAAVTKGTFGTVQWENGHRAKKKKKERFLPPHPNTLEIYHAFVASTVTHDLEEARTLFPAALPMRLHVDGMGRNQTMFLIMKRYDMTLDEYNNAIGFTSQRVAMVMIAQLLEGVSHLVDYGIAHRDLKSNNILVDLAEGSPHVVIADFGCCLADDTVGLHLPYPTTNTDRGGNSALMAPEIKLCKPGPHSTINYTKSDAWAVGAISYEILGMMNPFYGQGLDSESYKEKDLPELPDNTHPVLVKVIKGLLRKDPKTRPTARIAANMLHLSLWQPPVFTFTSMGDCPVLPAQISIQEHLKTWLLCMTTGLLCQRSTQNVKGHKLWLDPTEYQLCTTFMSGVTPNDLQQAANFLVD